MRTAMALALGLILAGCDKGPPPSPKPPPPAPKPLAPIMAPATTLKNDPTGRYTCVKCGTRTNDESCPNCKTVLKVRIEEKPHAPSSGGAGKSAVGAMWVCPKAGCTVQFPSGGACLKHADTQMVEQWFTCAKCPVKEAIPGACAKCGAALAPTVKR